MKIFIYSAIVLFFAAAVYCENVPIVLIENMAYFGITQSEYNSLGLSRVQKQRADKIKRNSSGRGMDDKSMFISVRDNFYRILERRQKDSYDNMLYDHCFDFYWDLADILRFSDWQRGKLDDMLRFVNIFSNEFERLFVGMLTDYQRDHYNYIQYGDYYRRH
ncbi:MAG: hypothetical protein KBT47_05925 [Armatimonadetes bacterium]|nr:hypothetical protein [Candidatus Hippobium faecium]